MIAKSFLFDTSKAKRELGWSPTLTNEEMLWRAYRYYRDRRGEIAEREAASPHRRAARMGAAVRLLKWIS